LSSDNGEISSRSRPYQPEARGPSGPGLGLGTKKKGKIYIFFFLFLIFVFIYFILSIGDVGPGVETQEKKKIYVPLSKKDKNKKSNERWTQASCTALLVQGSRVTYHQVPLIERVVTD